MHGFEAFAPGRTVDVLNSSKSGRDDSNANYMKPTRYISRPRSVINTGWESKPRSIGELTAFVVG